MNNFRQKLVNFFSYMNDYKIINLVIMTLTSIGLIWLVVPNILFESLFVLLILLSPIMFLHIVETPKNRPLLQTNDTAEKNTLLLNTKTILKHYIFKYFKIYMLFLIVLIFSLILLYVSSYISMGILLSGMERSLGQTIIIFFSAFVMLEGFSLLISIPIQSVFMDDSNINPFKSIFISRKFAKKNLIPHMISVGMFAVLFLPIIMLSDAIDSNMYLATILRVFYVLIILNYTIYDIKERKEKFELNVKSKK